MNEADVRALADLRAHLETVKENQPGPGDAPHDGHAVETVREDTYRGHRIVIRTTYTIEVDGRPVTGHLGVTNDGRVHYHAVPNVSFPSAIDLVRRLIDAFPEEFGDVEEPGDDGDGHDHHGHDH